MPGRTKYLEPKTEQRSYFMPKGMGDAFKDSCHGNASTGAQGALALWMAMEDYPSLREAAIRLAQTRELPAAVRELKERVIEIFTNDLIAGYIQELPAAKRAALVKEALHNAKKKAKP